MVRIRIGDKQIGEGGPTFIIAEAGSNHNGDLNIAKKMIDVASDAGADAVKFQTFRAEKLYPEHSGSADYLKTKKSIYQIIKEMEMPYDWIPELFEYCRGVGITFLSTPFDEESADKLEEVGIEAFKIASYESIHLPLIRHVAKKGRPIIMSTGLANLGEIEESLDAIYSTGNKDVALMHCIAKYPAPIEYTNIRVLDTLKSAFSIPVGLSDHSRDPFIVPYAAVARGADIIEKHFTLDNNLEGPDHKFAVEPHELKDMIRGIRAVESALGNPVKRVTPVEEELYKFGRRCIFAIEDIKRGNTFTEKNIRILRTGKLKPGLKPKYWDIILSKRAAKDIKKYECLTWDKIEFE